MGGALWLPAGGIRASQGTFSSFFFFFKCLSADQHLVISVAVLCFVILKCNI